MQITNMMVNPLKKEHLKNIEKIDTGVVTLNLEDAIAKSKKQEALNNIIDFLQISNKSTLKKIIVRVNPLLEGGEYEIKKLNSYNILAIRVAKVASKDDIIKALNLIKDDKELHISLETKEAFYNIVKWRVDSRFTTVNLGILDLLHSLNLPQELLKLDNPTIDYILSKFLVDSSSIGLEAVSFMFQDYSNTHEFTKWCKKEKLIGFNSKACLGPKQVKIASSIFKISIVQINRAKEIKDFFELNSKKGENGVMHNKYGFIDEPIYKDALYTLGLSKL